MPILPRMNNSRALYLSLLPVAIGLLLSFPAIAPISADSTLYLLHASKMAAGESFSFFRSGFTVPFAFFIWLTGDPLLGGVIWIRTIFFLTILCFWLFGRMMGGNLGAFLFSSLVLFNGATHYANTRILLDGLYPLATLSGIFLSWYALEKMSLRTSLTAACVMFYALLVKVSAAAGFFMIPAFMALTPKLWKDKQAWLIAAITTALPTIAYLLWSSLTPKGDMADFFEGTIRDFFFRTDILQMIKDSIPVLQRYRDDYLIPCLGPVWFSATALALTAMLAFRDSRARFILCAFGSQVPTFFIFGLVTMRPTQNMVVVFIMLMCFGYLLLQTYDYLKRCKLPAKLPDVTLALLTLTVIVFQMSAPGIKYRLEKQVGASTLLGKLVKGREISLDNLTNLNDQGSSRLFAFFEEQGTDLVLHDFQFRSLNNISAIPQYAPENVTLSPLYHQEKLNLTMPESLEFFRKENDINIILHNWHDEVNKRDLLTNHTKTPVLSLFIISLPAICRQAEGHKHVLLLFGKRWANVRDVFGREFGLTPVKNTDAYTAYSFDDLKNNGLCTGTKKLYLGHELKTLAQQNPQLPIPAIFLPILEKYGTTTDIFKGEGGDFSGVEFFE